LPKTNIFNDVPIKHKHMSFVSNGGKFRLYIVPNGLFFSKPTQPKFSLEHDTILYSLNSLSGGGSRDVPPFLTLFRGGGPQSIPPFYVIPASVFAV
jgi:hypothetical protein